MNQAGEDERVASDGLTLCLGRARGGLLLIGHRGGRGTAGGGAAGGVGAQTQRDLRAPSRRRPRRRPLSLELLRREPLDVLVPAGGREGDASAGHRLQTSPSRMSCHTCGPGVKRG